MFFKLLLETLQVEKYDKLYPKITTGELNGLTVLNDIPNIKSISATLSEYKVLDGIRAIPMSEFFDEDSKPQDFYVSKSDIDRVYELADEIKENGWIKPLIVVVEQDGPYILEGGHRSEALNLLKVKYLPALVVIDLD